MKSNVKNASLISLIVLAIFAVPVLAEDCVTDSYGNTMCGVSHYMGLVFEGNNNTLNLAGEDMAMIDGNQNRFGIGATVIRLESNITEHSFSVKTYEGGTWENFICSSFEGDVAGPFTITGKNMTALDACMTMPDTIKYTVDFSKQEAYIDLV